MQQLTNTMAITMPVLEKLIKRINSTALFKKTLFICVQHLLFTNIDLFRAMIHLGAIPHNIYVLGKIYSTNYSVSKLLTDMGIHISPRHNQESGLTSFREAFDADILAMMGKILCSRGKDNFDAIIILDDGGHCIKNYYQSTLFKNFRNVPVIGIEQTSSGLAFLQEPKYPSIEVASSALKQEVESLFIAKAILEKCPNLFENKAKTFSVIGLGAIGRSLANLLIDLGFTVFTYDKDSTKNFSFTRGFITRHIHEAFSKGDYIFGCTGKDIMHGLNVNDPILGNKILISCSSGDSEFKSLLEHNAPCSDTLLSNLKIKQDNGQTLTILAGGFPINLDTSGYSVKACDIQLTRALLLAALIQAAFILKASLTPAKRLMLDPLLQFFILGEWQHVGSIDIINSPIVNKLCNIDVIKSKSGGFFFPIEELYNFFMKPFQKQ
jgi:S-adenosylhomocysteine hydrolase